MEAPEPQSRTAHRAGREPGRPVRTASGRAPGAPRLRRVHRGCAGRARRRRGRRRPCGGRRDRPRAVERARSATASSEELLGSKRGLLLVLHLEYAVERQVADRVGEGEGTRRCRASRRGGSGALARRPAWRSEPPAARPGARHVSAARSTTSRTGEPLEGWAKPWWKTSKTSGIPSDRASGSTSATGQRSSFSTTSRARCSLRETLESTCEPRRRLAALGRPGADVQDDLVRLVELGTLRTAARGTRASATAAATTCGVRGGEDRVLAGMSRDAHVLRRGGGVQLARVAG